MIAACRRSTVGMLPRRERERPLPRPRTVSRTVAGTVVGLFASGISANSVFRIQRIGTYSSTLPITPLDPNALCLQVGDVSQRYPDSIPLSFQPCVAETTLSATASATTQLVLQGGGRRRRSLLQLTAEEQQSLDTQARQEWSFNANGELISEYYLRKTNKNLCVRRVKCAATQQVYDVGADLECDEMETASASLGRTMDGKVSFELAMPVRGGEQLKPVGRPSEAIQTLEPTCTSCGPYEMVQFCKSGKVHGLGLCMQGNPDAAGGEHVGWTQLRSHWLAPPDPNPGKPLFDVLKEVIPAPKNDGFGPVMGPSVCGSSVGDMANSDSFFYFMRSSVSGGTSGGTAAATLFGNRPVNLVKFEMNPHTVPTEEFLVKPKPEQVKVNLEHAV
eukprot:CAMPEP_0178995538 /NCGR_PEP_ID=MMETSP0795-20121207/7878_1 /TAXON_ID=88552 /ORGANISM="Amoebophrya sp., Strain Ameob2" /LENGTH=389 /DNA_ID=CAMNT_0020687847 /DNA_START=134 /DNA_END=1303 /DNA_ORIENTATION=-